MARPARRRGPLRLVAMIAATALLAGVSLAGAAPSGAAAPEPFAAAQWGIKQVGADVAWGVTRGQGARVGIIDTGVDLGHPELAGKVVASTRCLGTGGQASRCGGSAQDDSGHGTHVAGIVGAPLDGAGVAGVAPEASLLVVKALAADGSGEAHDVAAGIDWLLAQGAHVVNLSLAEILSPRRVQGSPLEAAIRRAAAAGAVVVLAAGNSGDAADGSTAFNLPAIVVGATGRDGRPARYSRPLDSGTRWGIVAPGGDGWSGTDGQVVSTYWFEGRRNAYAWSEGTSMAAPHVAGAAALLAAQGVRGHAAVDRLLATAAPVGCGTGCRGVLDARSAVGAASVAAGSQAASNPVSAASPALPPEAPPPASAGVSTPPSTPPTVPEVPPMAFDVGPIARAEPAPDQVAIAPVWRAVPLEVPSRPGRSRLAPPLALLAGLALLGVAGATGLCRRRLRAAEGW